MRARRATSGVGRAAWLLAALLLPLCAAQPSKTFSVTYDGDNLHPVIPNLHFITGKALDQLRDARTVVFVSRLSLFSIDRGVAVSEAPERFAVSYDIWEEKFKVTILGLNPRTKAGMTAAQAETWCLDNITIKATGLPPDRPFFLRFELRSAGDGELSRVISDPGISLRAFMELLSKKAGPDDQHWGPFESGRMRLSDLIRTPGRGARSG
jgi:hypothetical protein